MRASGLRMQDQGAGSRCRISVTLGTQSTYGISVGISERGQHTEIEVLEVAGLEAKYAALGTQSGYGIREQD